MSNQTILDQMGIIHLYLTTPEPPNQRIDIAKNAKQNFSISRYLYYRQQKKIGLRINSKSDQFLHKACSLAYKLLNSIFCSHSNISRQG